ncbi:MAG: hypothetical protein IPH49_02645 [Ignavibacteria bacterium]|nr:hypothetical protein [Ignavibacteria bacterium]MBK7032174.1 hypothetical protein [Ignavibacteria bacterium]
MEEAKELEALVKSGCRDSVVVRAFIEVIHRLSEAGVLDSDNNNVKRAVDVLYSAFGQIADDDLADLRYYHKLTDQELAKVVHDEIEGHKDQILTACADLVSEFNIVSAGAGLAKSNPLVPNR